MANLLKVLQRTGIALKKKPNKSLGHGFQTDLKYRSGKRCLQVRSSQGEVYIDGSAHAGSTIPAAEGFRWRSGSWGRVANPMWNVILVCLDKELPQTAAYAEQVAPLFACQVPEDPIRFATDCQSVCFEFAKRAGMGTAGVHIAVWA